MSHEVLRRRMADDRAETQRLRYVDELGEDRNRYLQELAGSWDDEALEDRVLADLRRNSAWLRSVDHHVDRYDPDEREADREQDRENARRPRQAS